MDALTRVSFSFSKLCWASGVQLKDLAFLRIEVVQNHQDVVEKFQSHEAGG